MVAHLAVKFGNSQQRVGYFDGVWGNQIDAAIGADDLLVFREGSFVGWLTVKRGTLLFRAQKLCAGGLTANGGIGCGARRLWRNGETHQNRNNRREKRRKPGEAIVEKVVFSHHAPLADFTLWIRWNSRDSRCNAANYSPGAGTKKLSGRTAYSLVKTVWPWELTSLWMARELNQPLAERPEPGLKYACCTFCT